MNGRKLMARTAGCVGKLTVHGDRIPASKSPLVIKLEEAVKEINCGQLEVTTEREGLPVAEKNDKWGSKPLLVEAKRTRGVAAVDTLDELLA